MAISNAWQRVLLALGLTLAAAGGALGEGRPPVPGLLFYASFDGEGAESFELVEHVRRGRDTPVPGRPGLFPNADFAAGNPVPTNQRRVEFVEDGRFGGAARVSDGVLAFDSFGNILAERGTAAFWVQVEQPLWSVPFRQGRMSRIFKVDDRQYAHRGYALHKFVVNTVDYQLEWRYGDREPVRFGRDHVHEIIDTRWGADFAHWTFSEHTHMAWAPEEEWQPGEWHHVALVWDAASGRRLFIDGRLAGEWEFLEHRVPQLDKISLGPRVGPGAAFSAQPLGLLYDELYIFDYPLGAEAVERLMRDNEPPAQRPAPGEAARRAKANWVVRHHDLDAAGIPDMPEAGMSARQVMVDRIRNVRAQRHEAMDGKLHMSWPVMYKDYRHAKTPYVLILEFDEAEAFNFIRFRGSFSGELVQGAETLAAFSGETFTQRLALEPPLQAQGALELVRREGSVNLLDFYELSPLPEADARPSAAYYPRVGSVEAAGKAGAMAAALYPPEDSRVLPAGRRPGPSGTVDMAPGQMLHLVTEPAGKDMLVSGVGVELAVEGFGADAVALVQAHDTATFNRELFEFDFRFQPAEGGRTLRLEMDLREPAGLRAGQSFWVSVRFDRPGRLLLGPGATRLRLRALPEKTRPLPGLNQILCDLFLHLSEPQAWLSYSEPRKQFSGIDELLTLCEHLMHFDPGNRTAKSIYSWVINRARVWQPDLEDPFAGLEAAEPEVSGPDWAVWSRESLLALRQHVDWWVDERQAPNGEFGGGVNDDSTMVPDWVQFALIHDPGGKYADSLRRLAELGVRRLMPEGLTSSPKGHLHAFEQGKNIIPFLQLLYYGHPHHLELLMRASRWYDGHLTALTPTGKRHFRSMWVSAEAVPADGVDTGWAILFKPGRYLAWYNGHPEVARVLQEWMDSWLSYGTEPSHPFGRNAIDFAAGEPKGNFSGSGIWHHLFWLYELTRDEKYARPVAEGLRETDARLPGFGASWWRHWRLLHPDEEVDRIVLRRTRQEAFEPGAPERREALLRSLRDSVLHMEKYLPIHTWVGQSTDRVGLRHNTAQSMALGGLPTQSKRIGHHYHAVSWEGADYDIARFVVSHGPDRLRVLLYSFHDEPQEVAMRAWRLDHGRYRVRGGVDERGDETIGSPDFEREQVLFRYEPVEFALPPGQVYVLEVEQVEKFDERVHERPDLALAPGDAVAENGKVRVIIHNTGSVRTPPALLRLERAGRAVAEKPIPPIEPALDLKPKTAEVVFEGITDPDGLVAVIDPAGEIAEITKANNRAEVVEGGE